MISEICDPACDENVAGVEKIHKPGEHISDHLPARTNDIEGSLIAFTAGCIDIFWREKAAILLQQFRQQITLSLQCSQFCFFGDRRTGSHGLQAAAVATAADRALLVHTNMPDITGASITAAVDLSIDHNAASDPGSDLYHQEMISINRIPGALLAQRHDINIVINHDHGCREDFFKKQADGVVLPIRHQWGCYQNSA